MEHPTGMEPDALALRCDSTSCGQFDFLPIKCQCSKFFCTDHISPDKHSCLSLGGPAEAQTGPSVRRQRCGLPNCQKPSLQSATSTSGDAGTEASLPSPAGCLKCSLSFCVDHRHPDLHSCAGLQEQEPDKKKRAQDVLARHFPNPSTHTPVAVRRTPKPSTDPRKLAQIQKIALMKMRHSATAADPRDKSSSIPVDERLYIKARSDIPGIPMREHVLWFRKTVATGRALDLISTDLGVSYQTPLCLVESSVTDPSNCPPLRNDVLLSEQVQDASTVILSPLPSVQNN